MTRRIRGLAVSLVGLSYVAACGIDDSGLAEPDAAQNIDAGGDVIAACTTLDAACLGGVGSSWQPIAISDAGCGAGFTATTLVTNPRVSSTSCACGSCEVIGAYTCDAGTPISGGNNCGDPPIATAPNGQCTQASAQHLEANPVQATGNVGCFAPNDAGSGAQSDPITLCVPGCDADFCGGGSRCVIGAGIAPCPAGLTLLAYAGSSADPGCAPCPCKADPPGACGGNVTGFQSTTCTDSGLVHTYAVGTCNVFDQNIDYGSVLVDLLPPDASCTVTGDAGAGDASLVAVQTICCL